MAVLPAAAPCVGVMDHDDDGSGSGGGLLLLLLPPGGCPCIVGARVEICVSHGIGIGGGSEAALGCYGCACVSNAGRQANSLAWQNGWRRRTGENVPLLPQQSLAEIHSTSYII